MLQKHPDDPISSSKTVHEHLWHSGEQEEGGHLLESNVVFLLGEEEEHVFLPLLTFKSLQLHTTFPHRFIEVSVFTAAGRWLHKSAVKETHGWKHRQGANLILLTQM